MIDHGVLMPRYKKTNIDAEAYGYTNLYFIEDQDEKKSIADYILMIEGAQVSWSLRKQSIVALLLCEAEYVVASYVACQVAWIEVLLEELKIMELKKMEFFVNNKLSINLANHHMCHGRSKHIEMRYHFLREQVNKGKLELENCKIE